MLKILIKSAVETFKADGIKVLLEQTLRYAMLYGSPAKIWRYWWNRLCGNTKQVVMVQGSLMALNLLDRGIHSDLFLNGVREPHATRYLQSLLKPEWTVVDIGANIGYYALMEAKIAKRVIAIEPGPENYKFLKHNIKMNRYAVETHQLAIGDQKGTVGFEISKACNWNKIAIGEGDIVVEMTTLDNLLTGQEVDFVRMDVEGYEMSIIKGMDYILTHNRPDMFIEVHRDLLKNYGSSQLEFMEALAEYGYRISKSFISARPGPEGEIRELLNCPQTRRLITERGIASHMFFSGGRC